MREGLDHTVLIIGAGVAGMEASLRLAQAGLKVALVERKAFIGGTAVLFEEVFPSLECSTCMLSPKLQELLQTSNIELLLLSEVERVMGAPGNYTVRIRKHSRYVDPVACIGCGACYEPCPISLPNEEEFGLSARKAISIPFAGALPNIPSIDESSCLHLRGEPCQACMDACVFGAIDFNQKEEVRELKVDAIIVATGASLQEPRRNGSHGRIDAAYTPLELERLRSSNGPTQGAIITRQGAPPRSVALVHCAGREEKGYCSSVCCMYLAKFNHYLRSKVPGVEIHEFYTDLCTPGPGQERFFMRMTEGTDLVRYHTIRVEEGADGLRIMTRSDEERESEIKVDMLVMATPLEPRGDSGDLAKVLEISTDETGFFASSVENPVISTKDGIYIIGGARGPTNIGSAVTDALAAVADILAMQGMVVR